MADITQADLEKCYKPQQVRSASCDDGSGVPGPALADAMETASKQARMILARAWPDPDAQTALIAGDQSIVSDICDLAMYELTKRSLAWVGADGKPIFLQTKKDAEQHLKDIAAAELRPNSEETAGANPTYRDRVNVPASPQFIFAPTVGTPRPGGY